MAQVTDIVRPVWDEISLGMLISEPTMVYEYQDNKKTDKLLGYKGKFLLTEGEAVGLQIDVKIGVTEKPDWVMMKHYQFEFDKEKSKTYVNGRALALSLWAKSIEPID